MVILGIDPGLRIAGYGVLKKESGRSFLVDAGYLSMPCAHPLHRRVGTFHRFFGEKIQQWGVTDVGLETPFLGKNAQNFLKLGYLRGIIYLLSDAHHLTLHEFSPRQVKQAVTGFGGASKEQVARAVLKLFPGVLPPKKNDVTDALAITLCGLWHCKKIFTH